MEREFPGGPMVKTPCFHCRWHKFYPWSGSKIPLAAWHGQKKKKKKCLDAGGEEREKGSEEGSSNPNFQLGATRGGHSLAE